MFTKLTQLFRNWWHFAVRGVLAIVFGVFALIWPDSTMLALVLLFGAFALADGFFAVATGIAARGYFERWWAILLEGITGIVIAVLTFFWPNITALVLLYVIAAWAVTTGIFEILAAIEFRHVLSGEWAMILAGLLSVVFGVLLFVFPGAGALSVVWLIGMYAIAAGIMEIIFAFRLRGLGHDLGITGTASA
jgi:uncharacterized membrane protein HdeD (DUF308 family)